MESAIFEKPAGLGAGEDEWMFTEKVDFAPLIKPDSHEDAPGCAGSVSDL